jgi:hypothetical protein
MSRFASGNRGIFFAQPRTWLIAVLALTALVYAPGYNGPFLFDDVPNLRPLADWLDGTTGWQEALLGNNSGPFGRPLSMLSFVVNALLFGMSPFWFKLVNLAIHLTCGGLVYALMSGLLHRDIRLHNRAPFIALGISALWLLHPMQVSTVLYVVQRMAQLSALFVLLALLAYFHGRLALEQNQQRRGCFLLFLAMPLATLAALLCKENGALAPLLCAVLELGYFRHTVHFPRPRCVSLFFLIVLLLPALAAVSLLTLSPESLLSGYEGRTFTLAERLLSQPRVMMGYIGALLLPSGPALGLYADDFAVSQSVMQPTSTLFAMLGLAALIAIALALRKRAPVVFTGIGFYFAGHVMESTIFPLEMYFEHRNYLPSAGFFLALIGAGVLLGSYLPKQATDSSRRLVLGGALATFALLSIATAARAWVWQSWTTIVEQGVKQHPDSVRAQLDAANILWAQGKIASTRKIFDRLATSDNALSRHLGFLNLAKLECQEFGRVEKASVEHVASIAGSKIQLAEMQGLESLGGLIRKPEVECLGLSRTELADILVRIADSAPQPSTQTPVWRTRFMAADLYRRDHRNGEATNQAAQAWMTGRADAAVGVVLGNLFYLNGDLDSARIVLADVRKKMKPWDVRNRKLISELQAALDAAPATSTPGQIQSPTVL